MTPINKAVSQWHNLVEQNNPALLKEVLAENVVFHSPVLHTPQKGKILTTMYLTAAMHVFDGNGFHYVKEIVQDNFAALEFETVIDDILINGIDIIQCNDEGEIIDFKVMIRPAQGLQKLQAKMLELLQK